MNHGLGQKRLGQAQVKSVADHRLRPTFHWHPGACVGETVFASQRCCIAVSPKKHQRHPTFVELRNIIRAAIPGAPKRQKASPCAATGLFNIQSIHKWSTSHQNHQMWGGTAVHGASVSKFHCLSSTTCHIQVAFAMEKAAVMDLLGALRSVASKDWCYDCTRCVPRPQAHSIGKVYAGLGHPNTFLWSTCSEQRQTAVLHCFSFCMFCSKNSWTRVKQQGSQTHSKNLKEMLFGFIHLSAHARTPAHPHRYKTQ